MDYPNRDKTKTTESVKWSGPLGPGLVTVCYFIRSTSNVLMAFKLLNRFSRHFEFKNNDKIVSAFFSKIRC